MGQFKIQIPVPSAEIIVDTLTEKVAEGKLTIEEAEDIMNKVGKVMGELATNSLQEFLKEKNKVRLTGFFLGIAATIAASLVGLAIYLDYFTV